MNIKIEAKKCNSVIGNIEDGVLDISASYEELINERYFFTIYETDEDFDKKEEIGTIEMTYIDISLSEEVGYGIAYVFDAISTEKQGIKEYLFDEDDMPNDEYVGYNKDVLYIDEIFIKNKYRNLGIGSQILNEISNLIRSTFKLKPGCIALLANPFEIVNGKIVPSTNEKEIEKLIEFYQNNGFERLEDTQYLVQRVEGI